MNTTSVVIKPKNNLDINKDLILKLFHAAVDQVNAMPDGPEKSAAMRCLTAGAIRRSKVEGVNSIPTFERFIKSLAEVQMVVDQPGTTNLLARFLVPEEFKAFTATARLRDLLRKGGLYACNTSPCSIRTVVDGKVNWVCKLHAPKVYPVRTESVTFVLNKEADTFIEWFAGEDINLWPPTTDLGSHWVHLGVDLVGENIRRSRKHG